MIKEKYVLKKQVHFGSLKTSVPAGTIMEVDRNNRKAFFGGVQHDNIEEIDICIRVGSIIPYVEGETCVNSEIKTYPKAKNNKKYEVIDSDVDSNIIQHDNKKEQKNTKMKVIYEKTASEKIKQESEKIMEVDSNEKIMQVINSDDGRVVATIPEKKVTPKGVPNNSTIVESDSDASIINGDQGKVIKTISKSENTKSVSSGKKLSSKHASTTSEEKAKANADARKKASDARRAKVKDKK